MQQKFKENSTIWVNIDNKYIGPAKIFDKFAGNGNILRKSGIGLSLPDKELMIKLFSEYIDEMSLDLKAFHGIPITMLFVPEDKITIIKE